MTTNRASKIYELPSQDEHSGVRLRADITAPKPIYAAVTAQGQERRYYLGTRFVEGIIVAEGWREELERDGVAPEQIEAAASWLAARCL
jgi:hypothetical protein